MDATADLEAALAREAAGPQGRIDAFLERRRIGFDGQELGIAQAWERLASLADPAGRRTLHKSLVAVEQEVMQHRMARRWARLRCLRDRAGMDPAGWAIARTGMDPETIPPLARGVLEGTAAAWGRVLREEIPRTAGTAAGEAGTWDLARTEAVLLSESGRDARAPGFLQEMRRCDPGWHAAQPGGHDRAACVARARAALRGLLLHARRLAALAQHERRVHAQWSLDGCDLSYRSLMEEALCVTHAKEFFLRDLGDDYRDARALCDMALAAAARERLVERCGPRWWAEPEVPRAPGRDALPDAAPLLRWFTAGEDPGT